MSDKEIIVSSLEKVKRRIRANQIFQDVSLAFALFLTFPLGFKILDLFNPFRGTTVIPVLALWFLALGVYSTWLLRRKGTLAQAAASVDKRLVLHDEIKTAYWFIDNPRPSDWIDKQIQRAATSVRRLDATNLYPGIVPKTSYIAAGILLLIVVLNFSPFSANHNWFALEAAPAYSLTDKEQDLFERAKKLLQGTEKSALADKLQNVMQQLQAGDISAAKAMQQLAEIQNALEKDKLDLDSIAAGLAEIARNFEKSRLLEPTAGALLGMKLTEAAQELGDVAEKLGKTPSELLREAQQSLQAASENSVPALDGLSRDFKEAASGLEQRNQRNTQLALAQAARELEQLALMIQNQELKDEASQQLEALLEAMRERQAEEGLPSDSKNGAGWTTPLPSGKAGSDAPPGNEPFGLEPSGEFVPNPPRLGPPTTLKVQLEREQIKGQRDQELKETEASRQESSNVEYRNVPADFGPPQKDVLKRSEIPWAYRPLIKDYFQAIQPPQ